MTGSDLLRIGTALLNDGAGNGTLSPFVREKLFSEAIRLPARISPLHRSRWLIGAFGLGLATFSAGHGDISPPGGGRATCITFLTGAGWSHP